MQRDPLVLAIAFVLAPLATAAGEETAAPASPYVREGVPHPGSDQVHWVPTFAQAERMAAETGRMMLVMGSVSDFSGY